jgi:hypothetical protein
MKTFVKAIDGAGVVGLIHFIKPGRWAVESQADGLRLVFTATLNAARRELSEQCPGAKQRTVKTMADLRRPKRLAA